MLAVKSTSTRQPGTRSALVPIVVRGGGAGKNSRQTSSNPAKCARSVKKTCAFTGLGGRHYHEPMAIEDPPRTRRWTRREYERLVDHGIFREDEHLELLDGLLVVREPQGSRHSAAVAALCAVLARAFGAGFH